ncbi:MAG: hypothetical protein IJQ66_06550 [Clostridia bacterium]|nr:hypothetical protein [Clostridia bacterium]
METWIIIFIIFAIIVCCLAAICIIADFIYDIRDRRRERKNVEVISDKNSTSKQQ